MSEPSPELDTLRTQLRSLRRQQLILGGLLIVAILVALATSQRYYRAKPPANLTKASLQARTEPIRTSPGNREHLAVYVENQSDGTWEPEVRNPVNLSYHLFSAGGEKLRFDNLRTPLPGPVPAGSGVDVNLMIIAPKEPGEYLVEIDLVQEHVTWFKDRGNKTIEVPLIVQ